MVVKAYSITRAYQMAVSIFLEICLLKGTYIENLRVVYQGNSEMVA